MPGTLNQITIIGGRVRFHAILLSAKEALDDGDWMEISALHPFSIHVSGITTADVQVRGSNIPAIPDNTDHHIQIGSTISSDNIVVVDVPLKWVKAMISQYTAGTISAHLEGLS